MIDNILRFGRFTSSRMSDLTSLGSRPMTEQELTEWKKNNPKSRKTTIMDWPGDAALTYMEEKQFERKLKRALNSASSSKPTDWGTCCESVAFSIMDTSFEIISDKTIVHPLYDFWAGSPDIKDGRAKKVGDLKCPFTLASFCKFVEYGKQGGIAEIRERHKDGEKYYQQVVSNACLLGYTSGLLAIFAPKKGETVNGRGVMDLIYDEAETLGFPWIRFADEQSLPIIPAESDYNMLNLIEFEIPQADIDAMTDIVCRAEKRMNTPIRVYDSNVVIHDSI